MSAQSAQAVDARRAPSSWHYALLLLVAAVVTGAIVAALIAGLSGSPTADGLLLAPFRWAPDPGLPLA